MNITILFWILFYLLIPALVIYLCRKFPILSKIGSIVLVYIIGIIIGNIFIFPFDGLSDKLYPIQDILTSVTIPIAMPLILFSCNFRRLPLRSASLSLIFGIISMTIVVISGYYIFRGMYDGDDFNKIAGMIVGVYTGGTPNLASLKMMLGVSEANYIILNTFDMICSFIYLTFLMVIGIRIFRKILPYKMVENVIGRGRLQRGVKSSRKEKKVEVKVERREKVLEEDMTEDAQVDAAELSNSLYQDIFTRENFGPTMRNITLSILITGISLGISFLITGEINMIALILSLTTLAIFASFIPKVREAKKSYDVGMYLVLIFSLVISSMVNVMEINISQSVSMFCYLLFAIFGSLTLQIIFARIFKIDADTTVITSVTMINSPLFVPMIADSMKNKKVIITGITIGIIGYAVGNYLGVIIAGLLGA